MLDGDFRAFPLHPDQARDRMNGTKAKEEKDFYAHYATYTYGSSLQILRQPTRKKLQFSIFTDARLQWTS